MSANKFQVDGALLFEQQFLRVPHENHRKVFRTSQKYVERELGSALALSAELAKSNATQINQESALKSVDNIISKVESLKRKLSDLNDSANVPTLAVINERLQHLATLDNFQTRDDPAYDRWADTRLDRWLVDWALRNGMDKTARKIAQERGITRLVDIDLFTDIRRIEDALRNHSCTEALAWCNENKSALRKIKNTLEFDLRFQEYIELIRKGKRLEAIAYSTKHLVPWQDTHLRQIKQASTLLAYPPTTTCRPYKFLYSPKRWTDLAIAFRTSIYTLNSLPTEPLLHLSLYAGLASLKLPACDEPSSRNVDCPVCDASGLGILAHDVPRSHHLNSTIVCRLSGKIMNEDNPPMAFPRNGYVYSKEALEQLASKSKTGKITCPRSGEECEFSGLRKLFIS